jgi:pimeloyl-ACP methyl ester carboxylesterase
MLLPVLGREIELVRLAPAHPRPGAPAIVFLHEALGSVSLWRDFPQRIADATGCEAVVYSRHGYGGSTPRPEPFTSSYLEDEALVWLRAVLEALELERPLLFGHSDGGSIALIHAGGSSRAVSGLIVLAPHVMVEEEALAGIESAKQQYQSTNFRRRLACHHLDAAAVFRRWHQVWLSAEYRSWNIEAYLPSISCPILAIQGDQDEYGTMDQLDRIARQAAQVELLKLAACRHSPHRDRPEAVIQATALFVDRVLGEETEDRRQKTEDRR